MMATQKGNMKSWISIVVPSYNVGDYIEECVNSLLMQTFDDFEILVINDKSTDDTLRLCEEFASKDNRVKVVNNTKNVGLAETRNVGLRHATGDWVVFVDSDDFVDDKKFLQHIYDNCSNCDMLFYGYSVFDETKNTKTPCYSSLSKINGKKNNAEIIEYLDKTNNLCWTAWTHGYVPNVGVIASLIKHYPQQFQYITQPPPICQELVFPQAL